MGGAGGWALGDWGSGRGSARVRKGCFPDGRPEALRSLQLCGEREDGAAGRSGRLFLLGEQKGLPCPDGQDLPPYLPATGGLDSPGRLSSHQRSGLWIHWRGLDMVPHTPRACHRDSTRAEAWTPQLPTPSSSGKEQHSLHLPPSGCYQCDSVDPSGHSLSHRP